MLAKAAILAVAQKLLGLAGAMSVHDRLEMKARSKEKGSVGEVNVPESATIMYCCKGKVLR